MTPVLMAVDDDRVGQRVLVLVVVVDPFTRAHVASFAVALRWHSGQHDWIHLDRTAERALGYVERTYDVSPLVSVGELHGAIGAVAEHARVKSGGVRGVPLFVLAHVAKPVARRHMLNAVAHLMHAHLAVGPITVDDGVVRPAVVLATHAARVEHLLLLGIVLGGSGCVVVVHVGVHCEWACRFSQLVHRSSRRGGSTLLRDDGHSKQSANYLYRSRVARLDISECSICR
jgi:hypothetical protein